MTLCTNPDHPPAILGFDDLTAAQLRNLERIIAPKRIDFAPLAPSRSTFERIDPAVIADLEMARVRSTPRGGMGGRA